MDAAKTIPVSHAGITYKKLIYRRDSAGRRSFAVQGHSRSLLLVPIESHVCDFLFVKNTHLLNAQGYVC